MTIALHRIYFRLMSNLIWGINLIFVKKHRYIFLFSACIAMLLFILINVVPVYAAEPAPYQFKNSSIYMRMFPRTPSQMAGFYEGRGFPSAAIHATTEQCFITVVVRNIGPNKIWLNLANWRIYNREGTINRITRNQWTKKWTELNVPKPYQATFYWTLLPEMRDLHHDEPVGGNITLTPSYTPFTIEANFATGENRQGKPLIVKMENVRCLKDGDLQKK